MDFRTIFIDTYSKSCDITENKCNKSTDCADASITYLNIKLVKNSNKILFLDRYYFSYGKKIDRLQKVNGILGGGQW